MDAGVEMQMLSTISLSVPYVTQSGLRGGAVKDRLKSEVAFSLPLETFRSQARTKSASRVSRE